MNLPTVSESTLERYGLIPKRPEVIDASMLSTFMACPSKFYLQYILGLRPARKDPIKDAPLAWGLCWHETMFAFMEASGQDVETRVVAGLQALDKHYPPYLTTETSKRGQSKQRMIEIFFEYVEKWIRKEAEYEVLRNEQYFDVYDEDVDLRWCGRIDSIRRIIRNGKVRVWDYKTTGAMGDTYFDQFEISFQFPGYVWSARKLMPGDDVLEITVDVLYTITKKNEFFQRTFRYDEFRLAEWERNVKMIVDRMNDILDRYLHQPEMWHKNWGECNKYGRCMLFSTHALNPRGNGRLLDFRDNYRIERWDPAAHAGEDD